MIEELKFDKKLAKTHSKQRCFGFFLKKKIKLTQNDVILIIFLSSFCQA